MAKRRVAFNQQELQKKYPALAQEFDKLMEERKPGNALYNLYIQYSGRWKDRGRERRLDLGTIIETLEDYGRAVNIQVG